MALPKLLLAASAAGVSVAVAVAEVIPAVSPGPFENMGQVWLGILVIAGQVFTHVSQTRREVRQRQWLVEDREYVAKTAERLRTELLHEQGVVAKKLDANTDISRDAAVAAKEAFNAANSLNEKIVAVGGMRRRVVNPKRRAGEKGKP